MEQNVNTAAMLEEEEASFDFLQLWTLFKSHWKWFPISIVLCLLIAGVYLFFTAPTVTVTGKMEIIDKSKKGGGGLSAGMAMLSNLPMGLGSSLGGAAGAGSIESEKEIILSTTLVRNVVKDLKLHTEYRLSKWGRKTLLYQNNPVEVTLDEAHLAWLDTELPLTFHQINLTITKDNGGYTVEPTLVEGKEKTDLPAQTFATLPATLKTDAGTLTLTENKLPAKQAKAYEGNYTLKVTITPPTTVANAFIGRTTLEPPSKKVMNILNISLTDENLLRGIDFVNHLVNAYNQRANDEKNEEALKTDEFVNARLAKIDAELGSSDAAWENSKKNFQITTPEVDAQEVMTKKSVYETELVAIGTELQLHDYLSEYVNDPANLYEIIPAGISSAASAGSADGASASSGGSAGTASLLAQHNTLVNQRKELLKSVSEMSPQLQRVNQSIKELQPVIQTALKRDRQQIVMRQNTLQREYGKYMGRVGSAPKMERVLTEIGRQREIKQGVYLLMLQKREETAMELANTTDKGKLIDPPAADPASSKPQKNMVLLVALFLGALLPAGILYLLQMFKQTIDTRAELESLTRLPIIGEIPSSNSDDALRTLRTNLLLNLKQNQKTILVTSATPAAGKTFLAQHLAATLTAIGKNALYLDCDLRKTSSSVTMSKENPSVSSVTMSEKSVSSVLMSEKSVSSVTMSKSSHPADILASADFAQQLKAAQASNDYVILDSPALGEYTDAYQLASFADATLYIVHSGKTPKSAISSLNTDKNLPNICLVLNEVK
jgi:uncharacterized protein involved in exopolysaccharide biosynthesis